MIIMRLISGSICRKIERSTMLWTCLILLTAGILLVQAGNTLFWITFGLFLSGAGLAEGFPVILGLVGDRFAKISATAFSFVFSIALVGNMVINYIMGIVVEKYGVAQLTSVAYIEILGMATLFFFLIQQTKKSKTKDYAGNTMAYERKGRNDKN
jgi:MFS family permease